MHDRFGIGLAVHEQSDRRAGAGYLALSVDLCCWGWPSACPLRISDEEGACSERAAIRPVWLASGETAARRLARAGLGTFGPSSRAGGRLANRVGACEAGGQVTGG